MNQVENTKVMLKEAQFVFDRVSKLEQLNDKEILDELINFCTDEGYITSYSK